MFNCGFYIKVNFATEIIWGSRKNLTLFLLEKRRYNCLPANPTAMASTIDKSGTVPKITISKEMIQNLKGVFPKKC